MKKKVFGRQLKRDTKERKALFKSLTRELLVREQIQTTEAKAKAVKGQIEKLITKAKNNAAETSRVMSGVFEKDIVKKLVENIAPRFATRPGGYTRIVRSGRRVQDNAQMVLLSFVEGPKQEGAPKIATADAAPVSKKTEKTKVVKKTIAPKKTEAKKK